MKLSVINFILTILLIGAVSWLIYRDVMSDTVPQTVRDVVTNTVSNQQTQGTDGCDSDCEAYIDEAVFAAIEEIELPVTTTETVVEKQTVTVTATPKPETKTTYIPIGTDYTTTDTDWKTVPGGKVYIDIENDFGGTPYVTFEASVKIAHGNGTAYVRLFDETNSVGVAGSDINASSSDYVQMKSGPVALWRGNNLYAIQIKSLNGFEASVTGAKVKVVYQ